MVSQAASQTRFRALKHESGIAGRPTIIVRVIACFQPLQDCQVSKRNIYLIWSHYILLPLDNCFHDQYISFSYQEVMNNGVFLLLFSRLSTSVICLNLSRRLIPNFRYQIQLEFIDFPFLFCVPQRSSKCFNIPD
jgi:hypothetical protein